MGTAPTPDLKFETGFRTNSAGIPYTLLLRIEAMLLLRIEAMLLLGIEAMGFPTLGLLM